MSETIVPMAEADDLSELLRLREDTIGALEEHVRRRDEIIRAREAEIRSAADIIRLREETIRAKDLEHGQAIAALVERVHEMEAVVRYREDEIHSAARIIGAREERIVALEKSLATQASCDPDEAWRSMTLTDKVVGCLDTIDGWCSPAKARWLTDMIVARRAVSIVEIGVYGGKSLIPMALAARSCGAAAVIGVEPWSAAVAISEPTNEANDEWWAKLDFAAVKTRFFANAVRYDVAAAITIMEMDSAAAFGILQPKGRQFDLVHIDGAHSPERALADARSWSTLVKPGGVLVFDDIGWPSVARARAFLTENFRVLDEVFEAGGSTYGAYQVVEPVPPEAVVERAPARPARQRASRPARPRSR